MKEDISKEDKITIVKKAIKPFLIMTLFAIIFANIILYIYKKSEIRAYKEIEQHSVEIPSMNIKHNIREIAADVFILANQKHISDLWDENKIINPNNLHELSENFLSMAKYKKKYAQLRLIDETGLETIRINFNNGSPYIVSKENLQNKKGRYYFDDAFNLQKNDIFISPLDLNIEHGKVEQPIKPIIRVGTPIFNEKDEKSGIVLLNYFGADLIKQFKNYLNATKTDNLMLLNSDGYWLCGINPDDEWGFMFEEKKDKTFGNCCPEAWKIIRSQQSGQFQTQAGLFTFGTIFPLAEGQISSTGTGKAFSPSLSKLDSKEYYWKVVSFLPTSYFKSRSNTRRFIAIYVLIVLSGLFLYIALLFSNNRFYRKIAELKIKDSEEKYRKIFNYAPMGIIIIDKEGNPIRGNKQVLEIFGSPSMEATKKINVLKFQNLIDVGFSKDFIKCLTSEKIIQNENYYTTRWNIRKYIKYTLAPIMDNNVVFGIQAIFEDNTERKKAEEILHLSNRILETTFDHIAVIEKGYKYKYVNSSYSKAHGLSKTEITGMSVSELLGNDLFDNLIKPKLDRCFSGEEIFYEGWFDFKMHKKRYMAVSYLPLKSQDGKIDSMTVISRDITKRKLAESENVRLSTAIKQSPSVITVTDLSGNLEYVNPKFTELTGYTSDEILGKNPRILKSGNQPSGMYCELWETISAGNDWHGEFHNKKKNGELFWESASISPIFDSENRIINYVKVAEDITEKKRNELELLKMEKLRSIGTLAGGIAHDFNNVLTGVYGYISLALMDLEKDHASYEYLVETEKSLDRATKLTKQLLTFSKGSIPIKKELDLIKVIEETVIFDLSGSNVKPIFNFADNLFSTKADEGQIQQVFSNLAINANQASPDGGHLYVSVINTFVKENEIIDLKPAKYLKIIVQDEGIGIPKKYIDKIFDPYFTTKKTGNGLGLATTYSIIKKHKGHLEIESEFGKGTKFTIYLPASNQKIDKKDKNSDNGIIEVVSSARVLIMDDEEVIRAMSSKMVSMLGYMVDTVAAGDEVISKYEESINIKNPYDVIILDLTIPGGMGGRETVKKILEINPNAKVIVSSGYTNGSVLADYQEFGFIGKIDKPYTIAKLKQALHQALSIV